MNTIFIVSLAIYQTKFWYHLIKLVKIKNYKIKLIIFDTESKKFLESKLFDNFINLAFNSKKNNLKSFSEIKKKINKENIKNINQILKHEKVFFGKRNNFQILNHYFDVFDFFNNFEEFHSRNNIFIQEIGGFVPNLVTYQFCKKKKINHYFIETAFFANHVHFLKNKTNCVPEKNNHKDINFNIDNYLNELKEKNLISIPIKDKKHFKLPFSKILDSNNIKRFVQKIFKKYLLNFKFVFGNDIIVTINHFRSILNYNLMKKKYLYDIQEEYIYFPLHVPNDFAITYRSPKYYNQLNFIDQISKIIYPKNLYIKEHPARIGSFDPKDINIILKKNKNLKIIDPKINNFKLIKNCKYIISINSKAGYEAIIYGKPVVTFGESYYKNSSLVSFCNNLSEFKLIHEGLKKKILEKEVLDFFAETKKNCFKGALYDMSFSNLEDFSNSLKQIIENE